MHITTHKKFSRIKINWIFVFLLVFISIFSSAERTFAQAAHSVDAILVYEDLVDYNVKYLFRGHTPVIPNSREIINPEYEK